MKLLIENGHVIRWNAQGRVEQLPNHHVLIEDNRILDVTRDVPQEFKADETVDASGNARQGQCDSLRCSRVTTALFISETQKPAPLYVRRSAPAAFCYSPVTTVSYVT